MRPRPWLVIPLLVVLGLSTRAAVEEGFVPLVNGDDPKQFELVGISPETLRIKDGVIEVSGQPNGYFATKTSYQNYVLKFDWKYERPEGLQSDAAFRGNSGLLIHIVAPHKVWPKCTEVQLANSDAGHIFAINGAKFSGKKDAAAQKKAIKPVGEWNEEEVVCEDGKIACRLNGIEVDKGTGAQPDAGTIGWQSEGGKILFRNVRIKELK